MRKNDLGIAVTAKKLAGSLILSHHNYLVTTCSQFRSTYIHANPQIFVYIHEYIHTQIYIDTCIHTYTLVHIHTYFHVYTCILTRIHRYILTRMHIYANNRDIYLYIHTHTCTHTNIHTCTCALMNSVLSQNQQSRFRNL